MKITQLRQLIREEIKSVVKEEDQENLNVSDVVGQSEQLVAFLEFVVDYKMLEVDLEYEEIVKRFLGD